MKLTVAGMVVWALAMGALIGCSMLGPGPMHGPTRSMIVTGHQHGQQVMLHRGDVLVVQLGTNPSTGHRWDVEGTLPTTLELTSDTFVAGSELVGTEGTQILKFKTVATGDGRLRLIYQRSWESGVEPLDEFQLQVTVQ